MHFISRALALVLSVVLATPTFVRAEDQACPTWLARAMEADYLAATTAAERSKASDAFIEFLRGLPKVENDETISLNSQQLSTAWWDIAFYRKGSPVADPQKLSDENLNALLLHPDRDLHLQSLRVAYQIANARMRLTENVARVDSWFTRKASKIPKPPKLGVRDPFPYVSARARVSNAERAKSITRYGVLKLRELASTGAMIVGNVLMPLPLSRILPGKWFRETDPVFRALEKNPNRDLSGTERVLLERYGALDTYTKRKALLLQNPKWFKGVHIAHGVAAWSILGVVAIAFGAAFVQSAWGDGTVTVQDLLEDPRYALKENQVQLMNETVPFPHLAIRIGDFVYSYGVDQMTVTPVKKYLQFQLERGEEKESKIAAFIRSKRSLQIATLNLTPDQVYRLQRHLALQTSKRYANITLMNDCASMVARALRSEAGFEIPKAFDPSPSSVIMHLATERMAGNPRIASVRLVTGESKQNPWLHVLRNAYINTVEAKFYYDPRTFVPMQVGRVAMDKSMKSNQIQYHTKADLAAYGLYRDQAEKKILEDPEIALYMENAASLTKTQEDRESIREIFQRRYETEFAKIDKNVNADFYDYVAGFYSIQYLNEAEKEILGSSSFNLSDAFHDPKFVGELTQLVSNIEQNAPEKNFQNVEVNHEK